MTTFAEELFEFMDNIMFLRGAGAEVDREREFQEQAEYQRKLAYKPTPVIERTKEALNCVDHSKFSTTVKNGIAEVKIKACSVCGNPMVVDEIERVTK